MTEYKTFDDYVKNTFNIEPRELTHISPEEQKKKTVAITVDELINIWNELTELKLKADRPKWHKVDNGDVPKNTNLVLVQTINGNTTLGIYYANAWREICNCKELTGIYAWCEIPKFEE